MCTAGQYQYKPYIQTHKEEAGECIDCETPCEQCSWCRDKFYPNKNPSAKQANCEYPKGITQIDKDRAKHPGAYFCMKCYQTNFSPAHVEDLTSIEQYVENQRGMIVNKPEGKFDTNKNVIFNFDQNRDMRLKLEAKFAMT